MYRPGTGYWTACFILAGYRAFLPITNQHQESPTIRSSTSWPFLISSLFTGLRLMTGLIMCSPWQEVFSYTETASIGYRNSPTGYRLYSFHWAVLLHISWLQRLPTYQVQLLSCPFSILVSEDRNRPADPHGDHLVSRLVTKFSGQPNLPVLLVTEYHRLQRFTVAKSKKDYRENKWVFWTSREKVVNTQTSFHCVWSGVSHHTNDIVYMLHLTGIWPGAKSR